MYGEKHSFTELTYVVGASMRQFQCVQTTYVTENKETFSEIYTYQEPCPLALPL